MPTFKRLVSAIETAEQIKNKWSHNESNTVDIVMLSPDNVYLLTDDEEVQMMMTIDNELPSDVCGIVQVQTNFLNGKTTMMKWRMITILS